MRVSKFWLLSGLVLASPVVAEPLPLETAAASFGARERILDASLSPDGTAIAFISPTSGQGSAVYTIPIGSQAQPKRVLAASGNPERLEWCRWASTSRLVCLIYYVQDADIDIKTSTRLVSVDIVKSDVKLLTRREGENAWAYSFYGGDIVDWLPDENGPVLMQQWHVPEGKVGSLIEKRDEGLAVDRVDTATAATRQILKPWKEADEYITDGRGNVRIVGTAKLDVDGYRDRNIRYQYRDPAGRDWKDLSVYDSITKDGFRPVAVDPATNMAFGFRKLDGRIAVYKRSLDGAGREELVFAHPQVDVDGLIRIGKSRRVVGISYATDHRTGVYFDQDLDAIRTKLGKALGANLAMEFVDSSIDEQKLLIFAGSDTNPGRYYLFDRTTRKLGELFSVRPELDQVKLAEVRPIRIKASDGAEIPGYLTLPAGSDGKNLPAIVLPHGGPGARDEWGFDWLPQFLANQGYAVLQPNFRGSTGYGDDWLKINGFQSWKTSISDVTDSGRWLVQQGIANPGKLAILGWSYGGYAALQAGVVAPELFKAIVAIAPVTDFDMLKMQERNTSSKFLFREYIGSGSHIVEGSPAQNAARIAAPVLLFHGTLDRNVKYRQSAFMEDKLKSAGKQVELVPFKNLDHYLESPEARTQMLTKIGRFLGQLR